MKEIFYTINKNIQSKNHGCTRTDERNFKFKDHSYDLRKKNCIEKRTIKSSKYSSGTVSNLGLKLWDILPENINKNRISS